MVVEKRAEERARALLLRRAEKWEEEGQVRRATAAYWTLVDYHPTTDEAKRAQELLLNLAQRFEEEGQVYEATTIYARMASG